MGLIKAKNSDLLDRMRVCVSCVCVCVRVSVCVRARARACVCVRAPGCPNSDLLKIEVLKSG